jgi:RND family efflux transporter MFP subunit
MRYATFREGRLRADSHESEATGPALLIVEVIHPRRGGIERATVQPGSIIAFESVDLYAMVSGYLKSQTVDIGSQIKKGEVLAEIDAPREARAADEAASLLLQARANADRAKARIETMQAEWKAALAAVTQAESDVGRVVAARELAEKQAERIRGLVSQDAIDKRLADEHQRDVDSSVAAERTARLAVVTAKARAATAAAKVEEARADAAEAEAATRVAEARLELARVNLAHTRIITPFDGVVTQRTFHPGAFIRSAVDGGGQPLLTVKRTDLMRVVVQVPDRDVVLANAGDAAVVKVDALEGREFPGKVARIGESEDPTTRMMRVEIDLPNPQRLLREGMYGTCSIALDSTSPNLTVPRSCVVERSGRTAGSVFLVRDGAATRKDVKLGADNGLLVEVLAGLKLDDAVIVRSGVRLDEGLPVTAVAEATAETIR